MVFIINNIMVVVMSKNTIYAIAMILLIIGGLNWGLIGLLNFNLVSFFFGTTIFSKIIYILVGASAILVAITKFKK